MTRSTLANPNKDHAVSFVRLAAAGRVRQAFADHVDARRFCHHDPAVEGSAEALRRAWEERHERAPLRNVQVLHAVADGDVVAVHCRLVQADRSEAATVHVLRFDGDRIVELWHVAQPAPAESPNRHGMF